MSTRVVVHRESAWRDEPEDLNSVIRASTQGERRCYAYARNVGLGMKRLAGRPRASHCLPQIAPEWNRWRCLVAITHN